MTEELQNPDRRVEDGARRNLVRGAFAVPAVLTLHNGSAFAAASASSCLAKRNLSPITEIPTASNDTFFRYQLWVIKESGTVKSAWIKGADLMVFIRASQAPFVPNGKWQAFNISTNALSGALTPTEPSPVAPQTFDQSGPWVALRVNSSGALVGAGATGLGSAVSDSCWDSFAIQAPR